MMLRAVTLLFVILSSGFAFAQNWPNNMGKLLEPNFSCKAMEDLYSNITGTLIERDYTKFLTREACRNKAIIDSFKGKDVPYCIALKPSRFSRCFYAIFKELERSKRISVQGVNQLHLAALEYIVRNRTQMRTDSTELDVLIISLRGLERRLRPDHLVTAGRPLDSQNYEQLEKMRRKELADAWRSAVRMLDKVESILGRLQNRPRLSPAALRFLEKRKTESERLKRVWKYSDPNRDSQIAGLDGGSAWPPDEKMPVPQSSSTAKQEDADLKSAESSDFEDEAFEEEVDEGQVDEGEWEDW